MIYLLDTNVVSELRNRPKADRNVRAWESRVNPSMMYLSVVTLYELELGVRQKERRASRQGEDLRNWLDYQIMPAFAGRILPVDIAVVQKCAALHVPDPRSFRDSLIAATGLVHNMTVVTRNTADFAPTGVAVLNPWSA